MSGDVHVRFCEGLGVKFPRATHPARSGVRQAKLAKDRRCKSSTGKGLANRPGPE